MSCRTPGEKQPKYIIARSPEGSAADVCAYDLTLWSRKIHRQDSELPQKKPPAGSRGLFRCPADPGVRPSEAIQVGDTQDIGISVVLADDMVAARGIHLIERNMPVYEQVRVADIPLAVVG